MLKSNPWRGRAARLKNIMDFLNNLQMGPEPILIAGPTASGKSALGLRLAERGNVHIINADALQIYADWRILTARPSDTEAATCPHRLYGHIGLTTPYSVGHWLTDVAAAIDAAQDAGATPVILGGTGLYFLGLTQGLVDIPPISHAVKRQADNIEATQGKDAFADLLRAADPQTYARVDTRNPARTRRAWEVLTQTGTGLAQWQDNTPPALVPLNPDRALILNSDTDWLNTRINTRMDMMIDQGALDEVRAVLDIGWDATLPSCQAIGAKEFVDHLSGTLSLNDAVAAAKMQTRRYAKRQRTWFRSKMSAWTQCHVSDAGVALL